MTAVHLPIVDDYHTAAQEANGQRYGGGKVRRGADGEDVAVKLELVGRRRVVVHCVLLPLVREGKEPPVGGKGGEMKLPDRAGEKKKLRGKTEQRGRSGKGIVTRTKKRNAMLRMRMEHDFGKGPALPVVAVVVANFEHVVIRRETDGL